LIGADGDDDENGVANPIMVRNLVIYTGDIIYVYHVFENL